MTDVILEYLHHVQEDRLSPWEFVIVFKDYTSTHVSDIHEIHLDTLRKAIIGIAIHIPGDDGNVWYLNPAGGTLEATIWNQERAVAYIKTHHSQLVKFFSRIQITKEPAVSDVGNYVNPIR
jgi:hypothetical protein